MLIIKWKAAKMVDFLENSKNELLLFLSKNIKADKAFKKVLY